MGRRVISLLLAVGMVAASCTSSGEETGEPRDPDTTTTTAPPPEPTYGGELVVATTSDVDGLNPTSSQWSAPGFAMARAVYDPLVVMDAENRWQPYLAESFVPNEDFTEWTITLRPDIEFHNGEKLDADALQTFLAAIFASPLSASGFPEIPIIVVTGELELQLLLEDSWSQMPVIFADQPGYVMAPEMVQAGTADAPIGTGPFVFDEWVRDASFRALRNDSYWQEGLPYFDAIEFRPAPDVETRYRTLTTSDVDVAESPGIRLDSIEELTGDGLKVVDDVDSTGASNLLLNLDNTPTDDLRIRQAIAHAIDVTSMRDTLADESYVIATQPHPPGSRWYADVDWPAFDTQLASDLVAEYESENGPVSMRIMVINQPQLTEPVEFLEQSLNGVGIDVDIDTLETTGFIQQFISGDYEGVYLGSFLMTADPDGSYHFLTSANADPNALINLNFPRHRSPALDDALARQRATDDDEQRYEAWAEIWQILADDLPYIWFHHAPMGFVLKDDIHGMTGFTTPEGVALPAINIWVPFWTQMYRAETG